MFVPIRAHMGMGWFVLALIIGPNHGSGSPQVSPNLEKQ